MNKENYYTMLWNGKEIDAESAIEDLIGTLQAYNKDKYVGYIKNSIVEVNITPDKEALQIRCIEGNMMNLTKEVKRIISGWNSEDILYSCTAIDNCMYINAFDLTEE